MTVYALVEFLHVIAAMGIFVAAGLEWSALGRLRRAESIQDARIAAQAARAPDRIGGPSMLVVFFAGMYLAHSAWSMSAPWIALSLGLLVVFGAVLGLVTARRQRGLRKQLDSHDALTPDLRARLRDPFLTASFRFRIALVAGIVFQMVAKPQWPVALTAAAAAIAVGVLASIPGWRTAAASARDALEQRVAQPRRYMNVATGPEPRQRSS